MRGISCELGGIVDRLDLKLSSLIMSIKKISFLPKMGSRSSGKTTDEALAVESKEAQNDAPVLHDQEIDLPHPPEIIDANDVDAALSAQGGMKLTEAATSSPKKSPRKFLSSTLNKLSPGRNKSKTSEEPPLFDVACENGANNGQENLDDEDMSVEVNMAAAMKGLTVKEVEDDNEQGPSNEDAIAEEKEATKKMTALEKLRKGSDDDDIDLKELAREIKGKLKGMVSKKSVKSESTPNNESSSDDKPVSDEENKVVTSNAENTADDKPAGEEKQADVSKVNPAETAVKASFLSKFFKSDDKSEKTAPSVPSQEEHPTNKREEEAVAVAAAVPAENTSEDAVPCDVAKASPGKRFKFTNLLSKKNDLSSVDATRSAPRMKAAEGASSSSDIQNDDKKANESEPKPEAEGMDDGMKSAELQKGKSIKSKFMKKLGIAGAAGAAGVASVEAFDTDKDKTTTLEVVVHADKPVSEVALEKVPVLAEADKAESDIINKEITQLDVKEETDQQDETSAESTGHDGDEATEEASLQDGRSSPEKSRCGLGDHIHDALMHAGQVVYETCGDPDYGTACKMLCVMEAAENACGGNSNEVEMEETN